MKAAPYSVMLISYGLSIYSVNMCVMRNFSVILLFFTVFCCFYSNISCNNRDKVNKKISCKVVPLKARPIIKADVIFSGTVLEVIKKPNLVLNFARRRRRRKIGKGKIVAKWKNFLEPAMFGWEQSFMKQWKKFLLRFAFHNPTFILKIVSFQVSSSKVKSLLQKLKLAGFFLIIVKRNGLLNRDLRVHGYFMRRFPVTDPFEISCIESVTFHH